MRIQYAEKANLPDGSTTQYVGRNGLGKQAGLEIYPMNHYVILTPINGKGNLAHGSMEIPLDGEILKEVANELLRIAADLTEDGQGKLKEEPGCE